MLSCNRTDLVQLFVRTPDSLRPNPANASMAFALCSALYIRMVPGLLLVQDFHRSPNKAFLYGRDVCSLAFIAMFLMIAVNLVAKIVESLPHFSLISIICCAAFTIAGLLSARLKGKRLVLSVIACDLSETD